MTDEQIDEIAESFFIELMPQLRDFARALLSASKPAAPAQSSSTPHPEYTRGWQDCLEMHIAPAQSCNCGANCLDKGAIEGCRYAEPAQSGELVADLIFNLARTDARNERIKLSSRIIAMLESAPQPAQTDEK